MKKISKINIEDEELLIFFNEKISERRINRGNLFFKVCILYFIQIMLISSLISFFVPEKKEDGETEEDSSPFKWPSNFFGQTITKIFSSFIMHLFTLPKIKNSLKEIRYLLSHKNDFD